MTPAPVELQISAENFRDSGKVEFVFDLQTKIYNFTVGTI
jgi:hypothetical protein